MRFAQLDLTRYGRFTDASLAFGAACREQPDLHIVYGDNEAGKTTALNAMLDLAFGIEAATPYKFLHQAAALRLGGVLELDGDTRQVIRLPKTALLDADERPLPEGLFNRDLAGLDRATYQVMFSLDEKTLAAGGESILASRGDLGQLLFSATAGLAAFAEALAKVRAETEAFYKVHGRKHDLGDLKRQLAALKERRAALDVTAAPFARMIANRDEAQAAYETSVRERGRLQADLATVRRQLATLPRLTEWRHLKAGHDALPAGPCVPDGWPETLAELQKTLVALRTRRVAAREELARLESEIDALPSDEAGLALATRVRNLAGLRARDATAAKDLPERYAALRLAEAKVADLLGDLGRADCATPRRLILPSGLVSRLRQSLETLSGLNAARHEALAELGNAEILLKETTAERDAVPSVSDDAVALAHLQGALAVAEADDSMSRTRLAERAVIAHGDALADRLAALAPWQGDADALAAVDVPARSERESMAQALAAARQRLEHWRAETGRLGDEIHRVTRVRDGLIAGQALVDDTTAAASRAARDAAWAAHLARLDIESATTFERALRADDMAASTRFAQAADLSELRALNRSLDMTSADLERAQRRHDAAERDCRDVEAHVAVRLAAFVGVPCDAPLAAIESFLAKRERALDARGLLRAAQADRAAATMVATATREHLAEALAALGASLPPEASLGAAVAAAYGVQEKLRAVRALRERVEGLAREVGDRQRQAQRADQARELWQESWAQMLQATWLAGEDVGRIRDALTTLADLGPALDHRDGLADRIGKMEADRAIFAAEIAEAANALGIADAANVDELAERVEARTRSAVAVAASRAAKIEERARAQDRLAELQPALDAAETRARQMTSAFAVTTLDDLTVALDASRRREDLAVRMRALEVEICSASAMETVEAAATALTALDRGEVERRHGELEALCEDQVERAQECFAALGRARDAVAAVNGDSTVARLEEERRTILVEIEERTMAHLALRAGVIAAEGAISLYRDRHRSSMMKHASDLFSSLTRGAYCGLAAQSIKEGEVLVGLVAGGGSKLSTEMSTATRCQLYLALRIAAYREFTKTRQPLPFVLDDVLETYDDDRAEASLSLLAETARTGQVIYLTHHRHLCEIARRVCPGAKHYDLGTIS